ncbi:MAG: type II toxin-antitoxin system RelE/ParE family toxin [Coriobacteriia bacterium]|nr:type II toxin-antitoxin system RelE/ParE family toxin [Methylobacter sp.]MDZ4169213.1 type II toxin-antitoxin system RelE/ParE family toxin [Coriobacteriia bacterium]MDP2099327.1 type II toxin-antitoxin system RelE/ParE family toxin [Methylobacter sp.]MDP2430248.1 type II toxin-antitoxin system RelE/ParE family toxin [Methylobacter sp.]MDP3056489.1 type II toxin-antitoxin system RelE/ParE family toxin [Methylobacter sp.]
MIYIYKTKVFDRWLKKTELTDSDLIQAVDEMNNGLIDADLGEHVFKKRIALPGRGKRSGVRTLVASKIKGQWFFLYGFAKNERDSISDQELRVLQAVAGSWLEQEQHQLQRAIDAGELKEVRKNGT